MRTHVCSRCRTEQSIPTHQFVKFDASVQPLCSDCWDGFRSWFFAGERIQRFLADRLEPAITPFPGTRIPQTPPAA